MIELLTTDQLKAAPYRLSVTFIRKHWQELGGKGKPRRFPREAVEAFLDAYYMAEIRAKRNAKAEAEALVTGIISRSRVVEQGTGMGQILGRGGRVARAAGTS